MDSESEKEIEVCVCLKPGSTEDSDREEILMVSNKLSVLDFAKIVFETFRAPIMQRGAKYLQIKKKRPKFDRFIGLKMQEIGVLEDGDILELHCFINPNSQNIEMLYEIEPDGGTANRDATFDLARQEHIGHGMTVATSVPVLGNVKKEPFDYQEPKYTTNQSTSNLFFEPLIPTSFMGAGIPSKNFSPVVPQGPPPGSKFNVENLFDFKSAQKEKSSASSSFSNSAPPAPAKESELKNEGVPIQKPPILRTDRMPPNPNGYQTEPKQRFFGGYNATTEFTGSRTPRGSHSYHPYNAGRDRSGDTGARRGKFNNFPRKDNYPTRGQGLVKFTNRRP